MKRFRMKAYLLFTLILGVFILQGCGNGGGKEAGGGHWDKPLVSIAVTPLTASIPVSGIQQFTATATFSDGSTLDVTRSASWTSGTAGVATISPTSGFATGIGSGITVITATLEGKTATATLAVNAATSVSFSVTPSLASIPVTGTQKFTAIETFSDGSTIDRTAASTWTALRTSGATNNASVGVNTGLATGAAVGQSLITATFGTQSDTATLNVTAATSVSFTVTPLVTSIPVTGTQQFTAIETFSDGSTFNRTTASTWSAARTSGALNNTSVGLNTGLATGDAVGQSTITATFGARSNSATLNVTAATSVSFTITPAVDSVPVTGTEQFTALETFSDGSTIDRTAASTWTAVRTSGALDNTTVGLHTGLATGVAAGQSTVRATFGALTNTATLNVTAAVPVAFVVTPVLASIPVTGTQKYSAVEIFNDGSTVDRTSASTWTAVRTSGALVNTTVGLNTGLATGVAVGQSTIRATYGTLTNTATLNVTAATSVSFAVTPALASIPVSGNQQYTAIETFSDGSTIDRTLASTWSAIRTSGALINATVGLNTGLANGVDIGQSTITAIFGTQSDTATLNVTAATSVAFVVSPALSTIPVTGTQRFTAIEIFSDGSTIDRTTTSIWTATRTSGALINATVGLNTGFATGIAVGQSDITATFGTLTDTSPLTVTAVTSVSFTVQPSLATIPVTGTQQYTAIETFSDGSTIDRTATSTWTAVRTSGALINATVGLNTGFATGVAVGASNITATFGLLTDTAPLTVVAATSVSFTVTPALFSIPVSGIQQYTAIETFSDGSTIDRTTTSNWSSVSTDGALINATVGLNTGFATGVDVGESDITATYGLLTDTAALAVTAATSVSFEVRPPVVTIQEGETQQYTAIESFSDGSTIDRTEDILTVWTASDPNATIVNGGLTPGLATGVTVTPLGDPVVITATYGVGLDAQIATGDLNIIAGPVPDEPLAIDLGSAATFGIAAGAGMTSTGITVVNGDVALSPTGTCTDAANNCAIATYANAAGLTVNGTIFFAGDTDPAGSGVTANAVKADLNTAWLEGMAMVPTMTVTGSQLSSVNHYVPGVYYNANLNMAVGGLAILDAGGDPNAVFVFQVGTDFSDSGIIANPSVITLTGGAQARNVWFIVGNDATIGNGSVWNGNVLAGNDLTINTGATMTGRALSGAVNAGAGAITLNNGASITVPE